MGRFSTTIQVFNSNRLNREQFISEFVKIIDSVGYFSSSENNFDISYFLIFQPNNKWITVGSNEYKKITFAHITAVKKSLKNCSPNVSAQKSSIVTGPKSNFSQIRILLTKLLSVDVNLMIIRQREKKNSVKISWKKTKNGTTFLLYGIKMRFLSRMLCVKLHLCLELNQNIWFLTLMISRIVGKMIQILYSCFLRKKKPD